MAESAKEVADVATDELETLRAELEQTRKQLRTAQKQVAEIRQAHTEAAAEFTKTRDRLQRVHAGEVERARLGMANRLFEVADNLERTLEAARHSAGDSLLSGVQLVRDQFFRELANFGVQTFNPQGEPFDPARHEAIGMIDTADPALNQCVVYVFKPGFRAGDTVLRAAIVRVGRYVAETTETVQSSSSEEAETTGDTSEVS